MSIIDHAYARFCTRRFGKATEDQLALSEQKWGTTFPDDYHRYILTYNGGCFSEPDFESPAQGCPQDALTYMHGIGTSHPTAEVECARVDEAVFEREASVAFSLVYEA